MGIPLLLHGKHAGPHAAYTPFGPWIVPWRFGAREQEYQSLRMGVGLIDYSTQAVIECQGKDRVDFLHRLLTNDIARLCPGMGCQAALLTPSAKLLAVLLVLADPDSLWLVCDLPRADVVVRTLNRYLFSEQLTLIHHERHKAVLALQGPRTIELLTQLTGAVVSLPSPGDHVTVSFHEIPIRLIRHSLIDGVGVLCALDDAHVEPVWEFLRQGGQAFGLHLVGWEALNTARIEAGIPWCGIDMDETNLLPETGLETVIASETKGCYLGQEVVARMQTYGSPNKRLCGLLVEGDQVPEVGDRIVTPSPETETVASAMTRTGEADERAARSAHATAALDTAGGRHGEIVGTVTSACHSPTLKCPIAMGYITRVAYEPGTVVEIVCGNARLSATVVARPIVPRR